VSNPREEDSGFMEDQRPSSSTTKWLYEEGCGSTNFV